MGINVQMDPALESLPNEELIRFFHCKKTEMSCMENPHTFLNQLRDHNLIPEKLYKKVISMKCKERKKDGVYQILDRLEKEKANSVRQFWSCVFNDHVLQHYAALRVLRNSLMDGSFRSYINLPAPPDEAQRENNTAQSKETPAKEKKGGKKRKKSVDETEEDEQPGPSSLSTPKLRKPTNKLKFSSPVKKGEKAAIWKWAIFKARLPVKCGDKEGTLYRDKLSKGGVCILSQRRWFTPTGFEKFAGKERCKNWKTSIRCQNTPLLKLIEEGDLEPPLAKRRCVRKSQRVLFITSSSESSSPRSDSSREMEDSGDEVQEEQSGVEELEDREEEEEEDEDEDDEEDEDEDETGPVDPSLFQAPSLPVSCGSMNGVFYKCRFASGLRGKSVRTEERWFTPEEFVKQEQTLTDGHWKKDINCHGKKLHYLLKKKILTIHSLLCKCTLCSFKEQDQLDQDNDDVCFICNSEGDLLCCDRCPRSFHHDCHLPAIQDDTLGEKWMCTFCVLKTYQSCWHDGHELDVLDSAITQYTVHCEYLLMCTYKEDVEHVFTEDPSITIPNYSSVISQPMWLNRVKEKLQNKEYSTLNQFVSDIRLIFHNCHIFNKGNEVDRLGSKLSEGFEKEFQAIFNIQ
ncbi:uncharacterized protein [Salminus brasiliensis]|uniref:uncharacterized protein n=1 Tax=Salminus brasiliensis TaxID=930266 RepID=UPI003B837A43